MTQSEITVYVKRRREILSAALFGVPVVGGMVGVVTDERRVAALILLAAFGPMLILSVREAARRGPVLILAADEVVDVKRGVAIRWDSVVDARVTEIRGAFITYHRLYLSSSASRRETPRRKATDTVEVPLLDRLSLPWDVVVAEIERRLPTTTVLRRATRVSATNTVSE